MIDIHSHILPGIDDGAATLADAVEMVRQAAAGGTTDIVATPHANLRYGYDPENVERKIAEVRAAAGGGPRIYRGCDFHLTAENIAGAVAEPGRYTINGGPYLLIEFPDLTVPRTTGEILERLLGAGMVPVVTHPERHPVLARQPEMLRGWVDRGCLVQVTGQSVTGRFGREAGDAAERLLREGLAHFVASDAHDPRHRPPGLEEARARVAAEHGEETARALFEDNPRAALEGRAVERAARRKRRRWWWRG